MLLQLAVPSVLSSGAFHLSCDEIVELVSKDSYLSVIVQPVVNLSEFFCYLVYSSFSVPCLVHQNTMYFSIFDTFFGLIFPQMNLSTLKPALFSPPTHCSDFVFSHLQTSSLLEEFSVVYKQLPSYIRKLKSILEALHYLYFPALVIYPVMPSLPFKTQLNSVFSVRLYILVPVFNGLPGSSSSYCLFCSFGI